MTNEEKEIRGQILELEVQIKSLNQKRHELQKTLALMLCPYKAGDILVNNKGVVARVTAIKPSYGDYGMVGRKILKDGSEGKVEITLWSWDGWRKSEL